MRQDDDDEDGQPAGIPGTSNVRIALASGQIDMYRDYTGTRWTTLLGHTPDQAPKDSAALFGAVASEELARNQVRWLPPAPLNNTYAIAASRANAQHWPRSSLRSAPS